MARATSTISNKDSRRALKASRSSSSQPQLRVFSLRLRAMLVSLLPSRPRQLMVLGKHLSLVRNHSDPKRIDNWCSF